MGSLFYLALTTWLKATPFTTLLICTGFPIFMGISYFFIMTERTVRVPLVVDESPKFAEQLSPEVGEVIPLNQSINSSEPIAKMSIGTKLRKIWVRSSGALREISILIFLVATIT